jgi:hypothetical protein
MEPQTLHRYGYVEGNPINWIDLLGLEVSAPHCGQGKCTPFPTSRVAPTYYRDGAPMSSANNTKTYWQTASGGANQYVCPVSNSPQPPYPTPVPTPTPGPVGLPVLPDVFGLIKHYLIDVPVLKYFRIGGEFDVKIKTDYAITPLLCIRVTNIYYHIEVDYDKQVTVDSKGRVRMGSYEFDLSDKEVSVEAGPLTTTMSSDTRKYEIKFRGMRVGILTASIKIDSYEKCPTEKDWLNAVNIGGTFAILTVVGMALVL